MKFITLTVNPAIDWHLSVERLERGQIAGAIGETRFPGGKGVNVSRILHGLGCDTLALCAAGGISGRELAELMERESLPHEIVSIQGETRRNLLIEEQNGSRIKINTSGPRISPDEAQRIFDRVLGSVSPGSILFLSGSLPPGMASGFYGNIIAAVKGREIQTTLDASGPALVEAVKASPEIIKMNLKELSWYLGREVTSLDGAFQSGDLRKLARKAELLVSGGAEGALLFGGGKCWRGFSKKKAPSLAVGAGDALLAGYMAKRSQGASLPHSLAFALSIATATAFAPSHEPAGEAAASACKSEIVVSML